MEGKITIVRSIAKTEKERAAIEAFSQKKAEQAKKSLEGVDLSLITGKKSL